MKFADRLFVLAQELVAQHPGFFQPKGPGSGDRATNDFMRELRDLAKKEFGSDFAERTICKDNDFRVDYYFPSEATIVEVALGLPKPKTEFERDVFKVILAQESGLEVKRLYFISKPGASKKCAQPGRKAIIDWVFRHHDISIEIHELSEVFT